MRDPIAICSRVGRRSIAQAQSDQDRNPRLKEYAESEKPHDEVRVCLHPLPRASNRLSIPSVSLGSVLGESFLIAATKDAEISKAPESRKPSNLPERPHSRSHSIETSASHGTTNEYREGLPKARGTFFQSTSKPGLKILRSQSCPDLSSVKQARLRAKKELGGESVDEKHAIGVQTEAGPENHGKGPDARVTSDSADKRLVDHASEPKSNLATEQNVHVAERDETPKNEPPVKPQEKFPDPPVKTGIELEVSLQTFLPIRTRAPILSRKPLQIAPHFARAEKRIVEKEDEELEAMVSRKTKRRSRIITTSAQSVTIVETTKLLQSDLSFKPTPSRFHELKHTNIDRSSFEFVSTVKTTSCSSPFEHLLEAQPEVRLEAQHTNADPVPFVSALETFNAIIPGCDAMYRFETMQNEPWLPFRCLANTKATNYFDDSKWSGRKCNWKLIHVDRHLIRRVLLQLQRMNIYSDGVECITIFEVLASEAICHHHKELAQMLFKSRVRELLGRRVQEQEVAHKLITVMSDSDFDIGWWLRPAPHGTLHYLPEYRSFSDPGSVSKEINHSIKSQARQPLVTETTRSINGLTEHDETRDGYLYVYWNRASFGHLKIGFTGKDVDQRLQEWEEQCHHIAEKQYQSPKKIKHAARVEKLIHTEFASHRVAEPACHGCGKKHIEWFRDLDLGFVIQRIEAWSEWISTYPYEYRGGAWRLKEDAEFELPLPSAIQTKAPKTPQKPRAPRSKSASPRQKLRPQLAREQSPSPQPRTRPSSLLTLLAAQIEPAVSAAKVMHTFSAPILT